MPSLWNACSQTKRSLTSNPFHSLWHQKDTLNRQRRLVMVSLYKPFEHLIFKKWCSIIHFKFWYCEIEVRCAGKPIRWRRILNSTNSGNRQTFSDNGLFYLAAALTYLVSKNTATPLLPEYKCVVRDVFTTLYACLNVTDTFFCNRCIDIVI